MAKLNGPLTLRWVEQAIPVAIASSKTRFIALLILDDFLGGLLRRGGGTFPREMGCHKAKRATIEAARSKSGC